MNIYGIRQENLQHLDLLAFGVNKEFQFVEDPAV